MSFGICGPLTSCDRVLPFPGRPRLARRRRMMEWFQTWRWEVAYTTYFRFRPEREFQETDHILLAQATTWARGSGITPLAAYCGICGHEHRADHWQGGGNPASLGYTCPSGLFLFYQSHSRFLLDPERWRDLQHQRCSPWHSWVHTCIFSPQANIRGSSTRHSITSTDTGKLTICSGQVRSD